MYWLFAPNIKVIHGFSTRFGGVSSGSFSSLNLGGHDDEQELIKQNRIIALSALNIDPQQISVLHQVHGSDVFKAMPGIQTGDALVSNEKGIALAIGIADCYPLLFHDSVNHVIGAAHAGWRGTVAGIAVNTVTEMVKLGADINCIQVAIGQGISLEKFEVGQEVIEQFKEQGFSGSCFSGRYIDLIEANKHILMQAGIKPENIWAMNRCTFQPDFFSYRRDNGKTGRMWAVIML